MKTKSKSQTEKPSAGNKRYLIGSIKTPVGPAGIVVWLNEVCGIERQPHMIGVKRYNKDTIWVHDTDENVKELIKDRDRILEAERHTRQLYAEHLREQRHGGK